MEHYLLIEPQYLAALISGEKTYELRQRRPDRQFNPGDVLVFDDGTGLEYRFMVTHVGNLQRAGVKGWDVLSVHRMVF